MYKIVTVLLFFLLTNYLKAQNTISLNDAISIALKNNFDIKISTNTIKIATNNATKGNAGLLPTINGEGNSEISSVDQRKSKTTNTFNLGAGINLEYPLYEGGAGKYRFNLLQIKKEQAKLQHKQAIESTIIQVISTYFTAANILESISTQKKSLEISNERLKRIKIENEFGNRTNLDILNARVDYNKDSVNLMNLKHNYISQKLNLLELISEKWNTKDFDVQTHIKGFAIFQLDNLIKQAKNNNTTLLNNRNILEQTRKKLQISKSEFQPKLYLQSGYNYNSINSAFFSPKNHNGQFTSKLSLKIPIFDGGRKRKNLANARLQSNNQELAIQQSELLIEKQVRLLYESYQNQLKNVAVETTNLEAVKLNLALSKELLKNGQITNTQFREAQQNLLLAQTNITQAKFNMKKLEFNILMYTGQLTDYFNIGN